MSEMMPIKESLPKHPSMQEDSRIGARGPQQAKGPHFLRPGSGRPLQH